MARNVVVFAPLLALAFSTAATAGERSLDNADLPRLEDIKPLADEGSFAIGPGGILHSFRLSVEGELSRLRQKEGQPAKLREDTRGVVATLSFGIDSWGFAGIAGRFSSSDMESQVVAFPLGLAADAESRGFDAVVGLRPLPFMRLGVLGGIGAGDASYAFTAFPGGSDSSSDGHRFGAFAGVTVPYGPVMVFADLSYLNVAGTQTYDPSNIPPVADWRSQVMSLALSAQYEVLPGWTLDGGIGLHHAFDQTVAPADTPNDTDWASAKLGLTYALSDTVDVRLGGMIWLFNDKFDYGRVSLGLTTKF